MNKVLRVLGFLLFFVLVTFSIIWAKQKIDLKQSCSEIIEGLITDNLVAKDYKYSHSMIKKYNPVFSNYVPLTSDIEASVDKVCYAKSKELGRLELWLSNRQDLTIKSAEYQSDGIVLVSLYFLETSTKAKNSNMKLTKIWSMNY